MHATKYEGKRGITWRVRVDLPAHPVTGKRRQKWITAPTKKEAEAQARRLLHSIESGGYVDGGKMPLREYLPQWLENFGHSAWEPTTYSRHAGIIHNHIIPAIGHIQLAKLTAVDLMTLYQSKREGGRLDGKPGGLSTRDVRYIHTLLKQALAHAVKWGLVIRNVADAVDPPPLKKREMTVWNTEQITAFLAHAGGARYYPVFALEIMTGLRRGELLGLRWSDIDLDAGELHVRQALKEVANGSVYFGEPKTHRSSRPVAVTPAAVMLLRQHKATQNQERLLAGELWEDWGLIFATELGKPIRPSNLSRAFRRLVRDAGLPAIRLHDLRHSHATLLFANGTHVKIVSERLGHASTSFTMDTYGHVLPGMQRDAVAHLDTLFTLSDMTGA